MRQSITKTLDLLAAVGIGIVLWATDKLDELGDAIDEALAAAMEELSDEDLT
jgi:hypothetical protein